MEDVYKYIEEYNLGKKRKMLIVFDDIISNKIHNKKPNPTIIDFFIRGRKINISIVFISQSYCNLLKDVRQNYTIFLT